MKTYLAYTVFLLLLCVEANAQHTPVWSQYLTNGLVLNPAIAGSRDALTVSATYRHQWVGIDGAPVTQMISAHTPLKGERVALGLHLTRDAIGVSSNLGGMANFAYRIKTPKYTLSFGLGVGIYQQSNQWDKVITHTDGDEAFVGQTQVLMLPAASAGLYYYDKKNFVSLSSPYIVNGTSNLPADIKAMMVLGRKIRVNRDVFLTPSAMMRLNLESVYQVDVNLMAAWKNSLELGASYRTNETLIGILRVRPNRQFSLAYSYDYLLGDLGRYEGGTHEITLSYDLKYQHSLTNPRFF